MNTTRWYCGSCGLVRDLHEGTDIAWCHHGVTNVPKARMVPVPASHPYARGSLPWGRTDPTTQPRSAA